jgi:hypothetical protein
MANIFEKMFDKLPMIPYFPGQNILCGIIFFIHGGGIFNIPIIGTIFNIIRKFLFYIIAVIIVLNIVFHYLKEYIKHWIENLPGGAILKGVFDMVTGNPLEGAEEIAEDIVLNGWWDPGPASFQFNKTCKEKFASKDFSSDYSLWKNEKWEDVKSDDTTYGTKNGKPGKLDKLCEKGYDCPDTSDLLYGHSYGYINAINIGNAPRKYLDCCNMNVEFCRGNTISDDSRMPVIPYLLCAVEGGVGAVVGGAEALECDAEKIAWHLCPFNCGSEPDCEGNPIEAAEDTAREWLQECQHNCITEVGCNDNDILKKQSQNAIRKKKGEPLLRFVGCENDSDPGCLGVFREPTPIDYAYSIKNILDEYVFSKFWFKAFVIPYVVYHILLLLCYKTAAGRGLRIVNKGYNMVKGVGKKIKGIVKK